MASLDERFNQAAEDVKKLTKRPTDKEFLELYALYKQAMFGDNTTAKPSVIELKAKAKWESWSEKKGIAQDEAKEKYVAYVRQTLEPKYA